MSLPLISIIMPVYDEEYGLFESLNSILAQSYPHWELIIVDDGSEDASPTIYRGYAEQDKRIKTFRQSNSGVSAARNKGINEASGDYLCFIDADDLVKADYLKDLVDSLCPEDGYGLVIQGLEERRPSGSISKEIIFPDCLLKGKERARAFTEMELYMSGYSASKLYDLSLIKRYQLHFNEHIRHAEDLLFMIEYIKISDYIRFNTFHNYLYQYRDASLSHSNRPYISERTCYEQLKSNIPALCQLFGLPSDGLARMEGVIALFLIRSLPALYRPPYALRCSERICELRSLQSYDLNLLAQQYHPSRKVEQIGKRLLLHRLFRIYDVYMALLFFIRYQIYSQLRD